MCFIASALMGYNGETKRWRVPMFKVGDGLGSSPCIGGQGTLGFQLDVFIMVYRLCLA